MLTPYPTPLRQKWFRNKHFATFASKETNFFNDEFVFMRFYRSYKNGKKRGYICKKTHINWYEKVQLAKVL